eukprot:9515185-Lingulodinium_polyedra.AAC.1
MASRVLVYPLTKVLSDLPTASHKPGELGSKDNAVFGCLSRCGRSCLGITRFAVVGIWHHDIVR